MRPLEQYFTLILLLVFGSIMVHSQAMDVTKQKIAFVPDESTALRIAEAIWIPIYGKEKIQKEKPFRGTLSNGVWTVTGTMQSGEQGAIVKGGVATARISQKSGCILGVSHGK